MRKLKRFKELGEAGLIIELSNGVVTVKHSEDKVVLYQSKVFTGYWDNLWEAIANSEHAKKISGVK